MELKQFITESLTAIVDGVAEAQKNAGTKKCQINPLVDAMEYCGQQPPGKPLFSKQKKATGHDYSEPAALIQTVEFDVAVTTSEESAKSGGGSAGIKVVGLSAGLGGGVQSTTSFQEVSRIKFAIPIAFPAATGQQ